MTRPNNWLVPASLGVLFAISTFMAGWVIADGVLFVLAAYIIIRGSRPPLWAIALTLAIIPGLCFTANPIATSTTAIRCLTVPTTLAWATARRDWNTTTFTLGMVGALMVQTVGLVAMIEHPRQSGLTVNASELGQVGLLLFVLLPKRGRVATAGVLATAVACLGAAASRVPIAGIALFAILSRQRRWIILAVITCGLAILIPSLQGVGGRFVSPRNISAAAELRIELITPSATQTYGDSGYLNEECRPHGFTWHGYGAGSFGATTRCVRPHISLVVAVYELGVFAVVPAALAGWAVARQRIPWFLAVTLASVWLFVDEPLAIPFGHYTLAAVAAVWGSRQNRPRMRFAGPPILKRWRRTSHSASRALRGWFSAD